MRKQDFSRRRSPIARQRRSPSFRGMVASSSAARKLAKTLSKKSGTRPERLLLKALRARRLQPLTNVAELPGTPDIVFMTAKVAIFCDGDFWHGRNIQARLKLLRRGANAKYWTEKIIANRRRDKQTTRALEKLHWTVIRYWESEIKQSAETVAKEIDVLLMTSKAPFSRPPSPTATRAIAAQPRSTKSDNRT